MNCSSKQAEDARAERKKKTTYRRDLAILDGESLAGSTPNNLVRLKTRGNSNIEDEIVTEYVQKYFEF